MYSGDQTDLKILTFFAWSWNMQMVALSTTNNRWSDHPLFIHIMEVIIHCSSFAAIAAAHLSGIVSIYILRNSTLMLSNAFCNSSQRLSFEWIINLSSLFSKLPQICSRGWGVDFEGSIISMFLQIPSIAGSSGNSLFMGIVIANSTQTTETS